MENGYENFVDTLRQSLLKETSYEEEMICYKKAEEYPPTSGDRLLLKNRQKEGVYEVCALYVRDLYDEFQKWMEHGEYHTGNYEKIRYACSFRVF